MKVINLFFYVILDAICG